MDAGVHFAHLFLRGHQGHNVALVAHAKQTKKPVLHALVQPRRNDFMRQARPGLDIRQQGGIEGIHQFLGAVAHHGSHLAARISIHRLIDRFPGLRVRRAQVARLIGAACPHWQRALA
ncbi:hypothetical protein D3C72_1647890 [compost metagenome]